MKWKYDQAKYKHNNGHLSKLNTNIKAEYGQEKFITRQTDLIKRTGKTHSMNQSKHKHQENTPCTEFRYQ